MRKGTQMQTKAQKSNPFRGRVAAMWLASAFLSLVTGLLAPAAAQAQTTLVSNTRNFFVNTMGVGQSGSLKFTHATQFTAGDNGNGYIQLYSAGDPAGRLTDW